MVSPKKDDAIIADAEPHFGHEMGGHNRQYSTSLCCCKYHEATHMFIGMVGSN